jgi:transglutaminase-like putative cysteine protease
VLPLRGGKRRKDLLIGAGLFGRRRLQPHQRTEDVRPELEADPGAQLDDLLVVDLAKNPLGAVRASEGLGLVRYTAHVGDGTADGPPRSLDVVIPRGEQSAVQRAATELQLADRTPEEALATVRAWLRGFRYARYLGPRPSGVSPLEDFLFRTRAGHCEYFATATVLLLRAGGIPARYATGYAVHEWSSLERRWVVRASDAHAWALAWIGGARRLGRGRGRGRRLENARRHLVVADVSVLALALERA